MEKESKKEEEKPQKRRLIRIQPINKPTSPYGMSSFNFAFVSAPEGGVRHQATSSMTCREYVNAAVWHSMNKLDGSQFNPDHGHFVDFECLRILFVYSPPNVSRFKECLFNGKVALNIMEKAAGWTPSKITTVVHPAYTNAWLLTGPKEWMSQPQLVSLMTWIMRLSSCEKIDTTDYDTLEASLHGLSYKRQSNDTSTYGSKFWNTMYIFLKYHEEIFKDMPLEKAWPLKLLISTSYFGTSSGLLTFVEGNAKYSNEVMEAYRRFKDLCKKHLPRENPLIKK